MKNANAIIGLFQGMFQNNNLTFYLERDQNTNAVASFDDVRAFQRHLKDNCIKLENEADESTSGPASFVVLDPDEQGNTHQSTCVEGTSLHPSL